MLGRTAFRRWRVAHLHEDRRLRSMVSLSPTTTFPAGTEARARLRCWAVRRRTRCSANRVMRGASHVLNAAGKSRSHISGAHPGPALYAQGTALQRARMAEHAVGECRHATAGPGALDGPPDAPRYSWRGAGWEDRDDDTAGALARGLAKVAAGRSSLMATPFRRGFARAARASAENDAAQQRRAAVFRATALRRTGGTT